MNLSEVAATATALAVISGVAIRFRVKVFKPARRFYQRTQTFFDEVLGYDADPAIGRAARKPGWGERLSGLESGQQDLRTLVTNGLRTAVDQTQRDVADIKTSQQTESTARADVAAKLSDYQTETRASIEELRSGQAELNELLARRAEEAEVVRVSELAKALAKEGIEMRRGVDEADEAEGP